MPSPNPTFKKLDKLFMEEFGIKIKNLTFWQLIKNPTKKRGKYLRKLKK